MEGSISGAGVDELRRADLILDQVFLRMLKLLKMVSLRCRQLKLFEVYQLLLKRLQRRADLEHELFLRRLELLEEVLPKLVLPKLQKFR